MHRDLVCVQQQVIGKVHPQIKTHHALHASALSWALKKFEEVADAFRHPGDIVSDQALNLCRTENAVDLLETAHVVGFSDRTDRKSTRLNSSHVKISYAVFCLKKKK